MFCCFSFLSSTNGNFFRYRPRSNPDGYGITAYCVDWTDGGTKEKPEIEIKHYDGTKWEETMQKGNTGITEHSKA
jgi:hypothetical protein